MKGRVRDEGLESSGSSRVLEGAVPKLPVHAAPPAVHVASLIHGHSVPPAAGEQPHRDIPQAPHLHRLVGVRGGPAAQLPKLQGRQGRCQPAGPTSSCGTLQCRRPMTFLQACRLIPDKRLSMPKPCQLPCAYICDKGTISEGGRHTSSDPPTLFHPQV